MGSAIANGLLATLLPCNCVLCGASGPALLCPGCRQQFFSTAIARCPVCANPLPSTASASPGLLHPVPCGRCQADHPAFDATVVAADYALPVDRLVLQLKFARQLALARLFAGLLAEAVQRTDAGACPRPALLCPVPLGLQRLSERGFNQALEIAVLWARRSASPSLPGSQYACATRRPRAARHMARAAPISRMLSPSPTGRWSKAGISAWWTM